MMFPSTEMGEAEDEQVWGWGRSGGPGYVKHVVSFKHPSLGVVEEATGDKK